MKKNILLQRSKKYQNDLKLINKKELASFVRQEFLHLLEKKLKLPIKLYHL